MTTPAKECDSASSCSTLIAGGDSFETLVFNSTPFDYTCPGADQQTAGLNALGSYEAICPTANESLNGDYAVKLTGAPRLTGGFSLPDPAVGPSCPRRSGHRHRSIRHQASGARPGTSPGLGRSSG